MAHKKAAGSAKNLRDSNPKYRGLKLAGGQFARAGNIIIRQKGDKYQLGRNVYKGKDFTIHASIDGVVVFTKKRVSRYDGRKYLKTMVHVLPHQDKTPSSKRSTTNKSRLSKTNAINTRSSKDQTKLVKSTTEKSTSLKSVDARDDLTKIE